MPSIPPGESFELLGAARHGHLATVRPDGSAHVVPFVFALEGRTLYWAVDRKPKRHDRIQRLRNIESNPEVEVLVDRYDEDWDRLWWVRASGTARVLTDGPERERALQLLRDRFAGYRTDPLDGPVVAVEVDRCAGWRATDAV